MPCENCGTTEEVHETELGCLCDTCYQILAQEHFDIIDNPDMI